MTTPSTGIAFAHRFAQANGIRMHYVEAGAGPLVVMCHGFPESWYSWRHQLPALAAAGFHAVAPDLRGYGQTEQPQPLEAYDILQLTGDIVGLVNAVGGKPAVIVGHDWGAWIAAHAALFRPDLFRALVLLSVPYAPRPPISPSQVEQARYPGKIFYQAVLRSPMAEQFFQSDVRARLLGALFRSSGEAGEKERWKPIMDPGEALAPLDIPKRPQWASEEDIDFFTAEFQRTGFSGALNYYRNMDRNWALTPFLDGAKITVPTLFVGGDKDPVMDFLGEQYAVLEHNVPALKKKILLPGVGHWTQQESPEEVNRLMIEFLKSL